MTLQDLKIWTLAKAEIFDYSNVRIFDEETANANPHTMIGFVLIFVVQSSISKEKAIYVLPVLCVMQRIDASSRNCHF